MFELLPLPVTALFPVALFPLLGIMSTNQTAMCYMKDTCMLYLGGEFYSASDLYRVELESGSRI